MAQNLMLEYAGGTPQLALTGQHPTGLTPDTETLASITGALENRDLTTPKLSIVRGYLPNRRSYNH